MKRRGHCKGTVFVIFILLEVAIAINIQATATSETNSRQTIVVDITGGGDYISIQEAINNADEGSTIYVKNGEYKEILEIKKQIYLIGEDKAKTKIYPISEENQYAIRIRKSVGVEISGFTVMNGGPGLYTTGIHISSSNTKIKNCNIYNTPVGIAIWSSNNLIEGCMFQGCKDEGIALLGSKYSDCNNNKIINCEFYRNCDGVELQYSSRNNITDCKFYENTHTGIDAIASSNNNNIISNCEIYDNEVHGIFISSSNNNIIENSIITNNEEDILTIGDSYDNEIINTITTKDLQQEDTQKETPIKTASTSDQTTEEKTNKNPIKYIFNILSNLNLHKIIYVFKLP